PENRGKGEYMRKKEHLNKWTWVTTLLLMCLGSGLARTVSAAETNDVVLRVQGEVGAPLALTLADLQSMPRVEVKVKEKDGSEAAFAGVNLAEIVKRSKPSLTEKCCGNAANTCVVVRAVDNYRAVFSLPEVQSEFTDRIVVLADRRDGKPLPPSLGP